MRKLLAISFMAALTFCCGTPQARAQDEQEQPEATEAAPAPPQPKPAVQESKPTANQHPKPIKPFRLDFSLNEIEDGKKINSRHYSMNLTAGSADEIKIGTRVPVVFGPATTVPQFQYLDVGTNIWANLREGGEEVQLEVRSEISNIDTNSAHDRNPALPPIVRQIKISGSTLLVAGKPITIGSMDDPNSN